MFVYKDGNIDYVQTSEGRMERGIYEIYNAEYFIKDHIGNLLVALFIDFRPVSGIMKIVY
jgi:hypothetical protein